MTPWWEVMWMQKTADSAYGLLIGLISISMTCQRISVIVRAKAALSWISSAFVMSYPIVPKARTRGETSVASGENKIYAKQPELSSVVPHFHPSILGFDCKNKISVPSVLTHYREPIWPPAIWVRHPKTPFSPKRQIWPLLLFCVLQPPINR